jgi:hypothetical protein
VRARRVECRHTVTGLDEEYGAPVDHLLIAVLPRHTDRDRRRSVIGKVRQVGGGQPVLFTSAEERRQNRAAEYHPDRTADDSVNTVDDACEESAAFGDF